MQALCSWFKSWRDEQSFFQLLITTMAGMNPDGNPGGNPFQVVHQLETLFQGQGETHFNQIEEFFLNRHGGQADQTGRWTQPAILTTQ